MGKKCGKCYKKKCRCSNRVVYETSYYSTPYSACSGYPYYGGCGVNPYYRPNVACGVAPPVACGVAPSVSCGVAPPVVGCGNPYPYTRVVEPYRPACGSCPY